MNRIMMPWGLAGIILAGALAAGGARASNLTVTNTALTAAADGKVGVRFDISWNNSWRDGINWDACWVFVKYSVDAGATWRHATLAASGTNPPGFAKGSGTNLDIVVPSDRKGAFIQRSAAGTGTVSNTGVKLRWDFAADGVSRAKIATVKMCAMEMAYVPAGAFWAGNTNGIINASFHAVGSDNSPTNITSTNAFTICWGGGDVSNAVVSNTFPNGYAGFYLMKTELSQRQYCDFLNTLTASQQASRHGANLYFNSVRNFIKKTAGGIGSPSFFGCDANSNAGPNTAVTDVAKLNETNDGEWVACNYLSWADGAAYADWAALRPFTELEFEKACRGPLPPVANEYAWGDATLEMPATSTLVASNTAAEAPNWGNCNYEQCTPDAPFRSGGYADASSGRTNAGAGYYGALDLSGNILERPVTVGNATGLAFTGLHGDGELTASGDANVTNWPGAASTGTGLRGGGWGFASTALRVADRTYATYVTTIRDTPYGWRGARSAP